MNRSPIPVVSSSAGIEQEIGIFSNRFSTLKHTQLKTEWLIVSIAILLEQPSLAINVNFGLES